MRVLFVCTANICRSPMAAGLLEHEAAGRGIDGVRAASAGFLESGHPVHEHAQSVLAARGVDMLGKRSAEVDARLVCAADLVLTMTTEHARRVVGRVPDALPKVYTLRDFALQVAPRRPEESIADWLARLPRPNVAAYHHDDPELDIADPIGEPLAVYERLAIDLGQALGWILVNGFPTSD